MVSRIGLGMSLKGRVEDDDFMLGLSLNCLCIGGHSSGIPPHTSSCLLQCNFHKDLFQDLKVLLLWYSVEQTNISVLQMKCPFAVYFPVPLCTTRYCSRSAPCYKVRRRYYKVQLQYFSVLQTPTNTIIILVFFFQIIILLIYYYYYLLFFFFQIIILLYYYFIKL